MKIIKKLKFYWPLIAITIYLGLFYIVYINLLSADIGRHITNGKIFFSGSLNDIRALLSTNYYSFSQNQYPIINHHWLFGIISYLTYAVGGFSLLILLNTAINILAICFTQISSLKLIPKNKLSVGIISIVVFLALPLLTHRLEIRPESFSLLFFALYYFLFSSMIIKKNKWTIPIVLLLQIFWVNIHLFFILGPLIAGYFLFEKISILLSEKKSILTILKNKMVKFWFGLCFALFSVSFINPYGEQSVLQPLTVFNNYAYRVAENQSTIFMIDYGTKIAFYVYVIIFSFIALVFSFALLFIKKIPLGKKLAQLLLLAIFIFLANKINRMTSFLAIVAIPILAQSIYETTTLIYKKYKKQINQPLLTISISTLGVIISMLLLSLKLFTPKIEIMGLGPSPKIEQPADFFIKNNLQGPIFNNYDVGSYLIYALFPQERIFVDNRPEAYSNSFFEKKFLPALKDEKVWHKLETEYDFNTIFFSRYDKMDGVQQFLYQRVIDENWIPVYADLYAVIFVKNIEKNQLIIDEFQIPNENFVVKKIDN